MKKIDILKTLKEKQALLEGHFLLSSGLHSPQYVQCAKLLQYPDVADEIGKALAGLVKDLKIELVVSPALGGVIIGQSVAKALNTRAVFTERQNNVMTLRRGFTVARGEKVLVVEDVITTGKSTGEAIQVLKNMGADIRGVCSIIDRSRGKLSWDLPVHSLWKAPIESFSADECVLCKKGVPVIKPGSRK